MSAARIGGNAGARDKPRDRIGDVLFRTAIAAVLYGLLAAASIQLSRLPGEIAGLWLANGAMIGLLWRLPRWRAPAVLAGACIGSIAANLATGSTPFAAIGFTIGNIGEIVAALVLIKRYVPPEARSSALAPILALIIATLIAPALGGVLACAILQTTGGFWHLWWAWWGSSATGGLLVMPLIFAATREAWRETASGNAGLELLLATLGCVAGVIYALTTIGHPFVVIALTLMVAAVRFTPLGTVILSTVTVSTVVVSGFTGVVTIVPGLSQSLGLSPNFVAAFAMAPPFFLAFLAERLRRDSLQLRLSEARFVSTMENAAIGMALVDLNGTIMRSNRALCAMLNYPEDELRGIAVRTITHPEDVDLDYREMSRIRDGKVDFYRLEKRYVRQDGEAFWGYLTASVVRDETSGTPLYFIGQVENIDARKRAEEELRALSKSVFEEKERLRITLHSIGDAVICTDMESRVTFMNPMAEALTGWTFDDAGNRPLIDVFRIIDDASGRPLPCPVHECLRSAAPFYIREDNTLLNRTGERLFVQDSAAPIRNAGGELLGCVLVFEDMSRARELQRELAHSTRHDSLTGLPNRMALEQALAEAAQQVQRRRRPCTLCFIDLDRFKVVNDSAGHAAGDALLVEMARTICGFVRDGDFVARLGGDEFAILLNDCAIEDAEQLATQVIGLISEYAFSWNGKVYRIGASVGITEIPAGILPIGEIMSRADVACYAAKSAGRSRVSVYRPDESEAGRYHRDIQVASGIRAAIADERFRLFAQKIQYLRPGCEHRAYHEILLRLEDEDGQLQLPGSFIPAAERYDLMGELDRWVIRTTLRRYGRRLIAEGDHSIAINLSANSLNDPTLWPFVERELRDTAFPPGRLHFEITETALINNLKIASLFVTAARAAGCGIALDDFGSGLSSFGYLREFPVDRIKIDGDFIRQIKTSAIDRAIVESINALGHRLGAQTIAEFVEDEETLALLYEMGLDMAQGYAIARPAPIEAMFQPATHHV